MPVEYSDIEGQLKGKTLKVYMYMLEHSNSRVGIREVQRRLGFSSPSLASYHLEKLASLGLVKKTATGDYFLVQEVKVGVLRLFTKIGRFLIPRFLFYAVWLSTMLAVYVSLYTQTGSTHNVAALIFGVSATIILWLETIKLWRESRSKM